MKWGKSYKKKPNLWEAEGYDVSEFKQNRFPEGNGAGKGRAWMSRAAGILNLGGGILGLSAWVAWSYSWPGYDPLGGDLVVYLSLSCAAIVLAGLAIWKKNWRLSLTAAICVLPAGYSNVDGGFAVGCLILGFAAMTFTILGRSRFK